MKSFVRVFGVVAGMAALLVSCNKQEEVFVPEDKTVEMTIVASSDETKTVLGSDGTVTWLASGEQLAVIEAAISNSTTTTAKETSSVGVTNDGGATMSFGVKMPAKTANSFGYYALYPNSAYVEKPTDLAKVKVDLASSQYPTESSFGPSADVLVAKPVTGLTTQPTELNLQFARVIAVGKMTIKDLSTAENVKKVTFTAAGKAVTGRSYIDFTTAAGVTYGYSGQGVDNVVLDYSDQTIAANGMAAYFTCWPFELGAGETFSVVVETESLIFTKNITLESKSLAFNVGRASAFNVSFSGIEGVKKVTATYTVTSTSAVSVSGDAPSGSSAKYSSTYTKSKNQLTGGTSMTLTLSGYEGMIVKGITLSMKSNSKSGAGYFSVKAGSTTLSSIGSSDSGVTFNNASWHGGWSTSYVDVKPALSNDAYTVQDGENIVIVIGATANSLYCQSFTIEYVADPSYVPEPVKLSTPIVTCSAKTETSLTFSWDAVANATDYQVSTDGGINYGSTQKATSYTWEGLTASTTKTLYVKAIGDGANYTDSDAASAEGTTTAGGGQNPEVTTVTLDETEIKDLGKIGYTDEKVIKDGDITWTIYAFKEAATRPHLQLKKDTGVYVKISAPSAIKEVRLTITSATNSKGGSEDISKHSAYSSSGTISLKSADADGESTTNDVVSCKGDAISNNKVTLVPDGSYNDLYLKVSAGARIWGIEVDY